MKYNSKKDLDPKYLLLTFTIICIGLIIVSYYAQDNVVFLKRYTTTVISPIQNGVNKLGNWTNSKMENLKTIESLNEENEKLRQELAEYKNDTNIMQQRLTELDDLRKLYNLDESYPELSKTAARVFSKDSTSWFSIFYIDKGSKDGLFEGANVLCDEGLCGIITECYESYSKVRSIIDDNSSISAKIMPANALCTLEGSLSQFQNGYLYAKNIDKNSAVSPGDKIVVSHISDRFHKGLLIGYVKEITLDTNNLTMTAKITPCVDFNNIDNVLVIIDKKDIVKE